MSRAVQNKMKEVILLGYSGHGVVVAEAAILSGHRIIGYGSLEKTLNNPFGLNYLGDENKQDFNWSRCTNYILGVGSNNLRRKISERVEEYGGKCCTIIHPESSLSNSILIQDGSFIARNVSVNPLVKVGRNVILNTNCSIDHECILGNNVHIAPGAILSGKVIVNDGAFIGENAVVKQGIEIGQNAIVGAGSVVLNNVEENQIVVGNPARIITR